MKKKASFKVLCRIVWSEDWDDAICDLRKTYRFCIYDLVYNRSTGHYAEWFGKEDIICFNVREYRKLHCEWFDTETEARFMSAINGYEVYHFRKFEHVSFCTFGEFSRKAVRL